MELVAPRDPGFAARAHQRWKTSGWGNEGKITHLLTARSTIIYNYNYIVIYIYLL